MKCRVIPYEGNEPYIFFSYSHKDAQRVYPLLEQIDSDGYRVWYDDGNHPGDDWPENIAEHLDGAAVCLAMLSGNSNNSPNCSREITFCVNKQKKLMAVMLEEYAMSLGVQLQLSTLHYEKRSSYSSDQALLKKLYETDEIKACQRTAEEKKQHVQKDAPKEVVMQKAAECDTQEQEEAQRRQRIHEELERRKRELEEAERKLRELEESQRRLREQEEAERRLREQEEAERRLREQEEHKQRLSDCQDFDNERTISNSIDFEDDDEKTIPDSRGIRDADCEDDRTVRASQRVLKLLRVSSRTVFTINSAQTKLGHSEKRCDIAIKDNDYISSYHADLIQHGTKIYLRDAGSTNGTFVNEKKLERGESVPLQNFSIFRLYDESFILIGQVTPSAKAAAGVAFLRNPSTMTVRVLSENTIQLGRRHAWEDGTMSDPKISRNHADITLRDDGFYLTDTSMNGTWINNKKLSKASRKLADHDQIRMEDTVLEFGFISL